MQNERTFHFNEEIAICRQRIERSVGTPMPSPDLRDLATQMLLEAIQQFERPLFPSCPQKLQKLRVCPHQGHRAPCGFAGSVLEIGTQRRIRRSGQPLTWRPRRPHYQVKIKASGENEDIAPTSWET